MENKLLEKAKSYRLKHRIKKEYTEQDVDMALALLYGEISAIEFSYAYSDKRTQAYWTMASILMWANTNKLIKIEKVNLSNTKEK